MPELPEVETVARSLSRRMTGRKVASCRLIFAPLLKSGLPRDLLGLSGRRVEKIARRGKYLIIRFEGGLSLVFHLKMTGGFVFVPRPSRPGQHTRLVLTFRDAGQSLHFQDIRKFGCLYVARGTEPGTLPALAGLGPEPLQISLAVFRRLVRGRRGRLKSLLLNQSFLAGIGNIYADEILFRSRLHPQRLASTLGEEDVDRLFRSIRFVLRRAVERGGSSIRDFSDSEGRRGRYQESHRAYGRESKPCPRCGTPILRRVIGGRASFFCPRCQAPITPRRRPASTSR
jgi:formamidopyrimidine-DNA glycosylase